jgi:hypothetical protein
MAMDVTIAGITLRLDSERALALEEGDQHYKEFLHTPQEPADLIEISVAVAPPVYPKDSRRLFDGGGAWELHKERNRYLYHTTACASDGLPLVGAGFTSVNTTKSPVVLNVHPASVDGGPLGYPARYPLDQLLLMYALIERGGLLVHAAGVEFGCKAYALPGVSGAGKSTISRLLAKRGHGPSLLSDDRLALRPSPELMSAWGTPWPGDAGAARNAGAPLAALLFLKQGETNEIRELSEPEAAKHLMPVSSVPWFDGLIVPQALETIESIVMQTPSYVFTFTPDERAASALEEFASA